MGKLYLNFDINWIEEKKLENHTILEIEKYIRQLEYVQLISGSSDEIIVVVELVNQQRFLDDFQAYLKNEFFENNVWKFVNVTGSNTAPENGGNFFDLEKISLAKENEIDSSDFN